MLGAPLGVEETRAVFAADNPHQFAWYSSITYCLVCEVRSLPQTSCAFGPTTL
jgi:hypothetical protein